MLKRFQSLKQRLFAANAIPDGVFSIARRGSVAANKISGSISNAVGAVGVVGKCEQEKVRGGAKYFVFGGIACITMDTAIENWEKNQNYPSDLTLRTCFEGVATRRPCLVSLRCKKGGHFLAKIIPRTPPR